MRELDEAERLGAELTALLWNRHEDRSLRAAYQRQNQAYALFMRSYGQVRRVVQYLRYEEGDADSYAPAATGGRKRREKKAGLPDGSEG